MKTAIVLVLVFFLLSGRSTFAEKSTLHIAVIGPLSGKSKARGEAMVRGVRLMVEEINQQGGVNGQPLKLLLFDDKNDKAEAEKQALAVAKSRALAVIGHRSSGPSTVAGKVYQKEKIPAVTGTATAESVTRDNPWYFRDIFDNSQQARFLAYYVHSILKKKSASIVFVRNNYGEGLAKDFEATANKLGLHIGYKRGYDPKGSNLDQTLKTIALELKALDEPGVVFLSVVSHEGIILVRHMKDMGFHPPIIGGDSIANKSFAESFKNLPLEIHNPGFYTDGIFAPTYLLFDVAGQKTQHFVAGFKTRYGVHPDAAMAAYYDAAALVVHVMEKIGIDGKDVAKERQRIRDYLGKMSGVKKAYHGVTGPIFFDDDGNAIKTVPIGVYRKRNLISAPVQLRAITNLKKIESLKTSLKRTGHLPKDEDVVQIEDLFVQKTRAVYTGIKVNHIRKIDLKNLTHELDFFIWFRFAGELKTENIEFLNAPAPIKMPAPVEEYRKGNITYRLYRLKGTFSMDFLGENYAFGQHALGVSFRHRDLDLDQLVFVNDNQHSEISGGQGLVTRMNKKKVLPPSSGFGVKQVFFYQNILSEDALGHPDLLEMQSETIDFSRFTAKIIIRKNELSLRGLLSGPVARVLFILCVFVLAALPFLKPGEGIGAHARGLWFFHAVSVLGALLSAEIIMVDLLIDRLTAYFLSLLSTGFDILWWIVPAILINLAIEDFIFKPLEIQTERTIPGIVRGFTSFLLYLLAFFGVIAFVFEQRLTSLLATSGVLAMIIGLAVQVNISNIFSGIAINMENPFRIGNWVKIGDYEEGKVVDITWRTTRVQTRDECILCIPNSIAAEAPIQNFSYPKDFFEMWFSVFVSPNHPPERVKKILLDAILSAEGVLPEPPPRVRFSGVTEWAAKYTAVFDFPDYGKKYTHREAIWLRVWTHLHRAGIKPLQKREIQLGKMSPERGVDAATPMAILNEIEIFQALSPESKEFLSRRMAVHYFSGDETIITQGEEGDSLFIIAEGVVGLEATLKSGTVLEVARLGAGNFFGGELTLFSDEPRMATVRSLTGTTVYEISREEMVPLIEEQPEVVQFISEILSQRKMVVDERTRLEKEEWEQSKEDESNQYLFSRVMNFFSRGPARSAAVMEELTLLAMVKKEGGPAEPFVCEVENLTYNGLDLLRLPGKAPFERGDTLEIEMRVENIIGDTLLLHGLLQKDAEVVQRGMIEQERMSVHFPSLTPFQREQVEMLLKRMYS